MIEKQVHRHLAEGGQWVGPHFTHPHDGLLHAIRSSGSQRSDYVEAIRQRLGSTDPRQRTGAVALLREVLPDIGADRALAALHSAPLEAGIQPAWRIDHGDLEQAAAVALAAHATAADTATLAWLKDLSISRSYRVFLLPSIARLEPDWLLSHVALVRHRDLAVLTALPQSRRAELIAALAPWPPESPSVLTRALWRRLPPAESARLRSLMWPE